MIFQYFVVWQSSYCMLSKEKVYTYCQCVTFICNFSQLLPYSLNPVHLFLICLYQALITASYTSRIGLFPCKSWLDLYSRKICNWVCLYNQGIEIQDYLPIENTPKLLVLLDQQCHLIDCQTSLFCHYGYHFPCGTQCSVHFQQGMKDREAKSHFF